MKSATQMKSTFGRFRSRREFIKLKNKFSRPNVGANRVRPQVMAQIAFKIKFDKCYKSVGANRVRPQVMAQIALKIKIDKCHKSVGAFIGRPLDE